MTVPHWKPLPQLFHAILPATGVGTGDGVVVAVGPICVHALMATMEAMSSAMVRGLTKRVYRAKALSLGVLANYAAGLAAHGVSGKPHRSRS